MKLLIIEDDSSLAKNLQKTLQKEGFAADVAQNLEQAEIEVDVNEYDCILLDLNLPDGSGFSFLDQLRKDSNQTPIVIMTARGDVEDRIKGLNLGADDYVPKPVNSNELIARVRAVIRRNSQNALPTITIEKLVVKPAEHVALANNKQLDLTAKEFAVLEYLALHSGQAITRTMLMEHIWGNDFNTFSNVIDVYIRNLRKKIKKHISQEMITTIRGKGYVLGKDVQKNSK